MNISYKWLKRFIDFSLDPKSLAAALTSVGLECDTVEEVETIRGGLRGLVIGKVLTCEEHPNSDHLHITTVDVGADAPLNIVCGAPNVAAGQTVVVATLGTTLYDGDKEFQIKKSKIRGVESFGMICAEDEIGIGKSHDGIMVLPDGITPGTPVATYFNVESDYMLEVELTPNRVDAASHYGTARDLKALMARENPQGPIPEVRIPDVSGFAPDRKEGATEIEVVDHQGAPRYSGITIRNVKVQESPEWLRNLLLAVGQRPINNIVDITNFILLGLGQPLHCFDLAKVKGDKVVVRTCPAGTKFTTLDGVERTLDEADLMICNAEEPMCIAGVFGGLDSGVTEATTDVFIESAYFNPTRVRRTARRHGLSTDASFRYERGTDPNITVYAAKVAALLIKELAGGEICGDVKDIYPDPVQNAKFSFSIDYCNKLIGKEIPVELIKRILEALEIRVLEGSTDKVLELEVPAYRVDVTRPCDVVEEILRIYGYNNVEVRSESHINISQPSETDYNYRLQNLVSEQLTAEGFLEIWNNSLTSISYYENSEQLPLEGAVKLMNPLSNDLGVLRRTLLFGGLETVSHNINRKASDLRIYEFGNVYSFDAETPATKERPLAPFTEKQMLGIWMTGNNLSASWDTKAEPLTVFNLKAVVLNIFSRMGIAPDSLALTQGSDEIFSVKLEIATRSGQTLATLGIVRTALLKRFDIPQEVFYAELEWKPLCKLARKAKVDFRPLPKTMPVRRDLALLIDKHVSFADIENAIRKTEKRLLRDVALFDVYEGKSLPEGKKSYAISIILQDDEKTLNDKAIEATMNKIVGALQKTLNAELR